MARGSLSETHNHLIVALDEKILSDDILNLPKRFMKRVLNYKWLYSIS